MKLRKINNLPIHLAMRSRITVQTYFKLSNLRYNFLYKKKAKTTLPTPILTKSVSAFEEPKKVTHNEVVQKSYD